MSSYTVSERVRAASPHLRFAPQRGRAEAHALGRESLPFSESPRAPVRDWKPDRLGETAEAGAPLSRLELLGDEDDGLDAWLQRMRTAWDQTTWYLFNAEGWR